MQPLVKNIVEQINKVFLGKEHQIKLALACLFSRGHLLIEDLPGMGKTTLAISLAKALGLQYSRVQFTSDLLPADILGVSIFDQTSATFEFRPGPIFSQIVLADEINRTSPKTQSALLEAMEERNVTIDGNTHALPKPFFVIATQNPLFQDGTYPLPESQLDRFLMCIGLGYPDKSVERALLAGSDPRTQIENIQCLVKPEDWQVFHSAHDSILVSDAVLDYVQRLIEYTRSQPEFSHGVSTRAALSLMQCAKTWAWIHGRDHLLPDDIQTVFPNVIGHRIKGQGGRHAQINSKLVSQTLNNVDVLV